MKVKFFNHEISFLIIVVDENSIKIQNSFVEETAFCGSDLDLIIIIIIIIMVYS